MHDPYLSTFLTNSQTPLQQHHHLRQGHENWLHAFLGDVGFLFVSLPLGTGHLCDNCRHPDFILLFFSGCWGVGFQKCSIIAIIAAWFWPNITWTSYIYNYCEYPFLALLFSPFQLFLDSSYPSSHFWFWAILFALFFRSHQFLSDPSPIIGNACHYNWLTDSCLVNLIDVTLVCEDTYSKPVEVVTVVDVSDKDCVGNSLLQIWKLRFGQKAKLGWDFEVDTCSRLWRWNFIKICVRICNRNSTLGSVVPLAMFVKGFGVKIINTSQIKCYRFLFWIACRSFLNDLFVGSVD